MVDGGSFAVWGDPNSRLQGKQSSLWNTRLAGVKTHTVMGGCPVGKEDDG
jgi:hypothetical protein